MIIISYLFFNLATFRLRPSKEPLVGLGTGVEIVLNLTPDMGTPVSQLLLVAGFCRSGLLGYDESYQQKNLK